MAQVTFSVRLLSGKLQHFTVDPATEIASIKKQLEQGLPEFHKVSLFLGGTELVEGSISEVELQAGTEVQAVTVASIEKATESMKSAMCEWRQANECHVERFNAIVSAPGVWDEEREKLLEAEDMKAIEVALVALRQFEKPAEFLAQFEDTLHKGICDAAVSVIELLLVDDGCFVNLLRCAAAREAAAIKLVNDFLKVFESMFELVGRHGDADTHWPEPQGGVFNYVEEFVSGATDRMFTASRLARQKISARKALESPSEERKVGRACSEEGSDSEEPLKPDGALTAAGDATAAAPNDHMSVELEAAIRASEAERLAQEGAEIQEATPPMKLRRLCR